MMSEPGKQIEIEDVLSSIRRLLAQDNSAAAPVKRQRPAPPVERSAPEPTREPVPEPEPQTDKGPAEVDYLVLTPAQRIETPAPPLVLGRPVAPADIGEELSRLESTIAQMEAAVAESGLEFEPEEGDPFEADGAALGDLVAHPEAALDRSVLDEADEPSAPAESLFDDADPEVSFLDEEALRDLVIEIIREELRGALGERITRNVRKLVRREVQRALVSRDFE